MKTSDYLIQSARTVAPGFHTHQVDDDVALQSISDFLVMADRLDDIKKALFYNRDLGLKKDDQVDLDLGDLDPDLIHGVLGVATEGAELVELLLGTDPSREKLMDECGDVLWYLALIFRSKGLTFEEVMERNINKLRIRFPDKFEEHLAVERDTDAEDKAFL